MNTFRQHEYEDEYKNIINNNIKRVEDKAIEFENAKKILMIDD